jgi:predicted DNA-binding WGR domain protein
MIHLTRSKLSGNVRCFYAMHLTQTLFGEWALVAEWGRIGSPGTVRERFF